MFKFNQSTRTNQFEDYSSDKSATTPQVAIYNEDDLSHLLFLEPADHGSHIVINKVDRGEPETPLESPWVIDTSCNTSDDESAVLSDCEDESDLEIPPSPSRRRGGTMSISDDDFEFPVFLGRQQDDEEEEEEVAPVAPLRPALKRSSPASSLEQQTTIQNEATKHVQIVEPEHHLVSVEGPLMSWWPLPVENMEYDWVEKSRQTSVPVAHQIHDVDGPLMSWWPASTEMLQYDWNEKFYE
ncbi:hypothetical protein SCAR479_12967 [Seiridium cardinale]|uniref:Uncharacterized protein n=1 Tax=Seiridium cardinale TaxID=138064 RepID=A0ABR2X9E3_9PEZI